MNEVATAETQYNDLLGRVAVDGHEGPFLRDLADKAGVPKDYLPVGGCFSPGLNTSLQPIALIDVLEVDQEVIREHGSLQAMSEIPVFKFAVQMPYEELARMIKRLSIVVTFKDLDGKPLKIINGPDTQ